MCELARHALMYRDARIHRDARIRLSPRITLCNLYRTCIFGPRQNLPKKLVQTTPSEHTHSNGVLLGSDGGESARLRCSGRHFLTCAPGLLVTGTPISAWLVMRNDRNRLCRRVVRQFCTHPSACRPAFPYLHYQGGMSLPKRVASARMNGSHSLMWCASISNLALRCCGTCVAPMQG